MLEHISDPLLSLAYPQACSICGESVENSRFGNACGECWARTRLFTGEETICSKCGRLQSLKTGPESFCRECDDHFYDKARAAGIYELALSASVLSLKQKPYISKHLRSIFLESFLRSPFYDSTKVIPVPLSKRRLLTRGFNQAGLLAKLLARETGIRLDEASFIRSKHARIHRAGMDRKGRELSVARSFEVVRKGFIASEVILLVDDVITSGATASACAKVLKRNGAKKVYVFAAARAV
ncbi:MAG: ComF family protein [Acidobacteria bacterium]|nr:ComF family protein [Acidobacteriota bacterium]